MQASMDALSQAKSALDAVEAGIRLVELDPNVRTVGVGGAPNILGKVECDAAIMCGTTLRTGAVGALQGYLHPISVARQVMEKSPHVMIVGQGAARFAQEIGAEKGALLTEAARANYANWLGDHAVPESEITQADAELVPVVWLTTQTHATHGTTVFLARDSQGHLAGGTSTSGWAFKYPGRLGDSPIIGAGLYVDDRYGAAACTHTGEMTIRAGTARAMLAYMKKGATVQAACHEAFQDLRALQGGYLGPVVLHALDANGTPYVLSTGSDDNVSYWWWAKGMQQPECRKPITEAL